MAEKSSFRFDEARHRYTLDGAVLPSVTGVIKECVGSGFEYLQDADWYLQRGRAVHAAAKFIAEAKSFECDPRIEGHVAALRKWFDDFKPVGPFRIEQPVYSEVYRYAGTPDLFCTLYGKPFCVDWKNSLSHERVAWQLGAYTLTQTNRGNGISGLGVELHEDGTYKTTKTLDLRRAQQEFLAMRSVYSVKERLGQLKENHADQ